MLATGWKHGQESSESPKGLISPECASVIFDICTTAGVLQDDFSVDLCMSANSIETILDSNIPSSYREEYFMNRDEIAQTILHSRYVNMYNLLGVSLSGELFRLFTCNHLWLHIFLFNQSTLH